MDLKTLSGDPGIEALRSGHSHDPHSVLGAHAVEVGGKRGVLVRAFHPDAVAVDLLVGDAEPLPMSGIGGGVYVAFVPDVRVPFAYRLRFHFDGTGTWERDDPYRFLPTLGELDLHLIGEGTHRRLWTVLGSQPRVIDGTAGTAFAVWAPSAASVSLVGDFNRWDGRIFPMRSLGSSGVWELFVPGVGPGALYKYEIPHAGGRAARQVRPARQGDGAPSGDRDARQRVALRVGRRRVDGSAREEGPTARARFHVRGSSRFVSAGT